MRKIRINIHTGCPSLQCPGESFSAELTVPATYLDGDSIKLRELEKQLATCNGCSVICVMPEENPIKIVVEGVNV